MSDSVKRMQDKICLVTGGGTGIGRAAAVRMAREGARAVVIAGRRAAEGEAVAAECRQLGAEGLFVETDVGREDDVVCLVGETMTRFGRLDMVFNNAGYQERRAPLEQ